MKRFIPQVSTACLLIAMAASAPAGIFKKSETQHKPNPSDPLAGNTSKQPDKELFDKAMLAMKKGRYDVARLDLQTLLNTYPESEYQMRAKLAVGDSWFREGGTAALTQAEGEYKDFITFFPNQPEAAEAQMRVADIYYMQMEKPDRDHTNADRAEQEYRTMIQQFPDSPLVPRAKQKLREVQEVLADRQFEVGAFYSSHENWPATIARLQTLTDRYPLYSHSDLALIGLGDAYAAEARYAQSIPSLSPKIKQELIRAYDDRAADAYTRVVTQYSTAPHVEDARERLIALNRPIPEPTQQELAESEAEEQSRIGVSLKDRALFLVKHGPTTVNAARIGEPSLTDTPQVTAPDINGQNRDLFNAAIGGKPLPPLGGNTAAAATQAASNAPPGAQGDSGSPLQLEAVPSADSGGANGGGPAIGASIVSQGGDSGGAADSQAAPAQGAQTDGQNAAPASAPSGSPATGAAPAAAATPGAVTPPTGDGLPPRYPGGVAPIRPADTTLPPVEKPAESAAQINDVHGGNAAQVQTGTDTGSSKKKKKQPKYNSSDESSSSHKKKKGLDKLNPF
ncbi:MAG TPA: outer membrane protein assembly factor BamD [Acidobacteriaceae bacterium]|nr:outer membrane protein assembly factor BamD [Acidobacteriaceae bacterium]